MEINVILLGGFFIASIYLLIFVYLFEYKKLRFYFSYLYKITGGDMPTHREIIRFVMPLWHYEETVVIRGRHKDKEVICTIRWGGEPDAMTCHGYPEIQIKLKTFLKSKVRCRKLPEHTYIKGSWIITKWLSPFGEFGLFNFSKSYIADLFEELYNAGRFVEKTKDKI